MTAAFALVFAPAAPSLELAFARSPSATAEFSAAYVGPPGAAGGAAYQHTQTLPLAVWTVAHNLGRRPSVSVTDHLGNLVLPDVKYVDANVVQVTHGVPLIGFAYCN